MTEAVEDDGWLLFSDTTVRNRFCGMCTACCTIVPVIIPTDVVGRLLGRLEIETLERYLAGPAH